MSARPPSVEVLVSNERLADLVSQHGRPIITDHVRAVLSGVRRQQNSPTDWPNVDELIDAVRTRAETPFGLQRVINATGVLLHTNLGRAPWSRFMVDQIAERLAGYVTLEYDLESGTRGVRGATVEAGLAALAGAEGALIVNNNAAAVYLALTTLAWNREVVISRGELVQIGGGFRIPEVLARSGAVLHEVGTTNKTSLRDYEAACGPQTGLILKVHRSNFVQKGFVEEVSASDLAALGKRKSLPVVWDIGSGAVDGVDVPALSGEPTLRDAVASGVHLATGSGDKLLGGPQGGLILGESDLIKRLRADPLYRAFRPGKATLLALEYIVAAHRSGRPGQLIPLYQLAAVTAHELQRRAERLAAVANEFGWMSKAVMTNDTFGGGAAPEAVLPGWGLRLTGRASADALEARARAHTPPIVGTITDGALVFSLRTVLAGEDAEIEHFLQAASTR